LLHYRDVSCQAMMVIRPLLQACANRADFWQKPQSPL
jgi:hypothetical protein